MEVKYKIDRVRLKVRVSRVRVSWQDYSNALSDEEVLEIDNFVKINELGIRVAWDMWKFKNKECLTLFMLKYG